MYFFPSLQLYKILKGLWHRKGIGVTAAFAEGPPGIQALGTVLSYAGSANPPPSQ